MCLCVCSKKRISVDAIEKKGLENCTTTIKTLIKRNGDLCHIRNFLYGDVLRSWYDIILPMKK